MYHIDDVFIAVSCHKHAKWLHALKDEWIRIHLVNWAEWIDRNLRPANVLYVLLIWRILLSIVWSNSDCNGMYQLIALHQRFQLHDSANHWSMIVEAELLLLLLDIDMILLDGKVGISFQLTFLHAECTQTIWVSVFSIMYQCVLICSNRHQWLCCRWVSAYFIDYTIVTYGV